MLPKPSRRETGTAIAVAASRMTMVSSMGHLLPGMPCLCPPQYRSGRRLRLPAALVQNPFRVAVRLDAPLQDKVAGGLEGRSVEAGGHGAIGRVARILPIDHGRHPRQRLQHLVL